MRHANLGVKGEEGIRFRGSLGIHEALYCHCHSSLLLPC